MSFTSGYESEAGSLSWDAPHRSAGKKVLDWSFTAKGRKEPITVAVSVERYDGGLRFKASSDSLAEAVVDSDINRLHQVVEKALLEQVDALAGIDWQDWLEVVVTGSSSRFDEGAHRTLGGEVKVVVNRLKRGVVRESGRVVTINRNGVVVDFPQARSIEDGSMRIDIGIKISGHSYYETDGEKERSYIPATAENVLALQEVVGMMDALKTRLGQLLSQQAVQEKLADVHKAMAGLIGHDRQQGAAQR